MARRTLIHAVYARGAMRQRLRLLVSTDTNLLDLVYPTVDAFVERGPDDHDGVDLDPEVFLIPTVDVPASTASGMYLGGQLARDLAEAQDFVQYMIQTKHEIMLFVTFE